MKEEVMTMSSSEVEEETNSKGEKVVFGCAEEDDEDVQNAPDSRVISRS